MTNTVSLGLAKELWELGLKIETEKCYYDVLLQDKKRKLFLCSGNKLEECPNDFISFKAYHAPSTDELLAVLPYKINKIDYLIIRKAFVGYYVQYWDYESKEMFIKIKDEILPEALGSMCKYLLEQGHVLKDGILTK